MSDTMTETEVRAVRWVEFILAPLLITSVLALGRCTANAQDELIILQGTVSAQSTLNGDTKLAIAEIQKDANATKIDIAKIQTNQENFKGQIDKLQLTQEETNRLLRGLQ